MPGDEECPRWPCSVSGRNLPLQSKSAGAGHDQLVLQVVGANSNVQARSLDVVPQQACAAHKPHDYRGVQQQAAQQVNKHALPPPLASRDLQEAVTPAWQRPRNEAKLVGREQLDDAACKLNRDHPPCATRGKTESSIPDLPKAGYRCSSGWSRSRRWRKAMHDAPLGYLIVAFGSF